MDKIAFPNKEKLLGETSALVQECVSDLCAAFWLAVKFHHVLAMLYCLEGDFKKARRCVEDLKEVSSEIQDNDSFESSRTFNLTPTDVRLDL